MNPIAVLVHVPDIGSALEWYQRAFRTATLSKHTQSPELAILDLDGFSIELVQADSKVGSGKSGTVLYWSVENLDESLIHFQSLGAKLYRGPIKVDVKTRMCQIEDPFDNLIGLRGE